MNEVEKTWQEFWKPIVAPDGKIDLEQVKKELYDFKTLMGSVSRVYDVVTGGMISKPLTGSEAVIAVFNDHMQSLVDDAIEDEQETLGSE